MNPKIKRKMTEFTINEISAVDIPAQEGARVSIMKRADANEKDIEKYGSLSSVITSEIDGHSHGVSVNRCGGIIGIDVTYSTSMTEQDLDKDHAPSHSHAVARDESGKYVLSMTAGHTHTVDNTAIVSAINEIALSTTKNLDENVTPDGVEKMKTEKEKLEEMKAKKEKEMMNKGEDSTADAIAALTKRADRSDAIIKLSAGHRAHFDALVNDSAQDSFLALDVKARDAEITKAAEADALAKAGDPVIFITSEGVEIRKSAGEAVLHLAKSNDVLLKKNAEMTESIAKRELHARVETDLSHMAGTIEQRAALLKAAESIENEADRASAIDLLKSQNENMTAAFNQYGHGGAVEPSSAEADIEKLAKSYMAKNGGTIEAASAAVLDTPEGAQLYNKTMVN